MKILLLFPMADGQTGPAIKYAFEQLGHEVKAVDAKLQPYDSYKVACDFKPDLVFCSRTQALTWKVQEIKAKFKNAIVCMWNVDTRRRINKWENLFPLIKHCDYHFVPDTKTISQWKQINPNTFWLPQGLQNEVYGKPKAITDADRKRYSCDVSWAGTRTGVHKGRMRFLDAIASLGVKFNQWGCGGIPRVYDKEHNKMAMLSKINIACSGWPMNGKYSSVRNYKILGAGGFLLELNRKGLYELFPPNVLDCYATPQELAKKVRYWLGHEKEREETAECGYKWVHENATYTHRIKMALEYMT